MNNDERRRFEIASNRCLSVCLLHFDSPRRARPLGAPRPAALSSECVGANPCVRPWHSRQIVLFIDTTVQIYNFAPLRGASLSCVAKKGTKVRQKKATWGRRSDCAVVTLLHFGTTLDSRNSPSPKTPSAQGISSTNQIKNLGSHLLRCAKSLYCSSRFCKLFDKFLFDFP